MHLSPTPALLLAALLLAAAAPACLSSFDADSVELQSGPAEDNNATNNNNTGSNNSTASNNNTSSNNNTGSNNNTSSNNNTGLNNNTSSCTDRDGDGVPSGSSCAEGLPLDCDDANAAVSPFEAELCNGIDDDCSGDADDGVSAPQCPLREGVCLGARRPCQGEMGFGECNAATYGEDWVAEELSPDHCDGLDNDCDGQTDEGCGCESGEERPCGSAEGTCEQGLQTCAESTWGACEGATGPAEELCDGLDNDCDGQEDNDLGLPPLCALQQGVCTGRRAICQGAAGWSTCGAAEYGAGWVVSEDGRHCDGLDNDCDGTVDEGCGCVDGNTRACGSDTGVCEQGMQMCTQGIWGACEGSVASSPELCDGLDNNCNGQTDDLTVPNAGCPSRPSVTASCAQGACVYACLPGFVDRNGDLGMSAGDGCECTVNDEVCDGSDNDCDGLVDLDDPDVDRQSCLDRLPLPVSPLGSVETRTDPAFEPQGAQRRFRRGGEVCNTLPVVAGMGKKATCFAGVDHQVYCAGQIGDFSSPNSFEPMNELTDASGGVENAQPIQILMTNEDLCVVYTSGEAWCLGSNTFGEFGSGATGGANQPMRWGLTALNIILLATDNNEICAMKSDGSIGCAGRVSGPTAKSNFLPLRIPTPPPSAELSMYLQQDLILLDDTSNYRASAGLASCLLNVRNELQCGSSAWSPSLPEGNTLRVDGFEANGSTLKACVLNERADVWCRKGGSDLLLAQRAFSSPKPGVAQLLIGHSGQDAACAVLDDGSLRCVGANAEGRLGADEQIIAWPGREVLPAGSVRTARCD